MLILYFPFGNLVGKEKNKAWSSNGPVIKEEGPEGIGTGKKIAQVGEISNVNQNNYSNQKY